VKSRSDAEIPNIMSPRASEVRCTLVRPSAKSLDAKALERKCLNRLASLVWEACDWRWEDYGGRWKAGDFNFLVVESTLGTEAILYAQIWSEPLEPVVFEVCSGEMNPGAKLYLAEEVGSRLLALGFTAPNGKGNFEKVVGIWNPGDAEQIAADMLKIFADVFGYTGATPLTVRFVRGERARRAIVHQALTPEDLKKILDGAGFTTSISKNTSKPMIELAAGGGFAGGVICDARKENSNLYTEFDFVSVVGQATAEEGQFLTSLTTTRRFIKCAQDEDGDVTFRASVVTHGGVTTAAIVDFAVNFAAVMRDINDQLLRGPKPKKSQPREKRPAATLVH
jgi:hypothetical protein